MNQIDQNPDYKKIYQFVVNEYKKSGHFHYGFVDETYFSLRVYEYAKKLIKTQKQIIKKEQLLVSAILHDIGKTKLNFSLVFGSKLDSDTKYNEWIKHSKLSVPIAKKFLTSLGHSDEFVNEVCYLIENHDKRKNEIKQKSIELQILQDADILSDIGIIGIIRSFLYSGEFKRSIIGTIKYIQKIDRTENGDILNLDISKEIAKTEMDKQIELNKEFAKTIESDLL